MIREGRPSDLGRLRAIQSATLAEPWPALLKAAVDGPPLVLVCERSRPVAYALVVPDDDVAYVAEFAVAPDRQGEGIGSDLMHALVARLREQSVERIRLTARADDDRARSFYERRGFSVIERVPDHYESGDGVLFERTL